jgi:DNA-binding transcriptional MocR family regulator
MSDVDIFPEEPPHRGRLRAIWGFVIDPGFLACPYVLLLHQAALGLTSEHLNVLLNIMAHRHAAGRMAFPHSSTIAKRMGTSQRSVQRSLAWLTANGFIEKVKRVRRDEPQGYDLSPLIDKLKPYAWERIQLMREKRYPEVLSDDLVIELANKHEQRSVEEMFGGVGRRLQENQMMLAKKTADEL